MLIPLGDLLPSGILTNTGISKVVPTGHQKGIDHGLKELLVFSNEGLHYSCCMFHFTDLNLHYEMTQMSR